MFDSSLRVLFYVTTHLSSTVCKCVPCQQRKSHQLQQILFSRGHDSYNYACKAWPLTVVRRTSLSVSLSLSLSWSLSLPSRLKRGDGAFLHAFAFLYLVGTSWSFSCGTLPAALVPTLVDDSPVAIAVILLPCVVVSSVVRAWRVRQANILDTAINGWFLLLVSIGALCLDTANRLLIADALLAGFRFLLALFSCSNCHCLLTFFKRWTKTCAFFLCHHKEGGGCFARLLEMRLKQHPQVTRDVFSGLRQFLRICLRCSASWATESTRSWCSAPKVSCRGHGAWVRWSRRVLTILMSSWCGFQNFGGRRRTLSWTWGFPWRGASLGCSMASIWTCYCQL